MSYTIHPAEVSDSRVVAQLICKLLADLNERSGARFVADPNKIEETCKDMLARDGFAGFIAIEEDTKLPIGVITIAPAMAIYNGGDLGVITELYVDRQIRSKGVGKVLISKVLEFAKRKNWSKVEVGAPNKDEWPRTIEFYKQNGFEEKGTKLRMTI